MEIFNFISENGNDILSKFNKKDLEELLRRLKLYKISYRDSLNLGENSTIGTEIEFSTQNPNQLINELNAYNSKLISEGKLSDDKWFLKKEWSVNDGYEITSPVLKDSKDDWIQLREVCDMIEKSGATVNIETAAHVHIGDQILGYNVANWLNFLKLYIAYENILFRFSYGEYECERLCLPNFAHPSARELERHMRNIDETSMNTWKLITSLPLIHKEDALGIRKPNMDTIEFRSANGTLNPIIWQNNINFLEHFVRYGTNANFDYDTINRRRKEQDFSTPLQSYNEININQALELCDLIFTSNLDKINFLRQYLKDFETTRTFTKSKSFTNR